MNELIERSILFALAIALASVIGCAPQVSRYRYLSFEETPGSKIDSVAPVEVEDLVFGSTIPVEYSIERKDYTLRIVIDPNSYAPNAIIAPEDSPGVRLVPRPERGARADRPRPCGSYDELAGASAGFAFSWVTCGEDASPEEFVVAFDVVGERFGRVEEALRFRLERDGILWLPDAL
jgi:hypothetical protein